MKYRISDESEFSTPPPWDPRTIFWTALVSGLLCPFAWIGGMVWFAGNWTRLHQPQARTIAWSLLIIGLFAQAHLVGLAFLIGRTPTLAEEMAGGLLSLVPVALLLQQVWSQQPAFAAYERPGAQRAKAAPVVLNFAVLALAWLLLLDQVTR